MTRTDQPYLTHRDTADEAPERSRSWRPSDLFHCRHERIIEFGGGYRECLSCHWREPVDEADRD